MDRKVDTKIQFSGLKPGTYDYSYRLESEFFAGFENAELSDGTVDFEVKLERQEHLLMFTFRFNGVIKSVCDRCLAPLDIPVSGERHLCVKFGDDSRSDDENVIVLPDSAFEIDLAQYLYEWVVLAIPMVKHHEQGACDPEMLKYLTPDTPQPVSDQAVDPRWAALANLK